MPELTASEPTTQDFEPKNQALEPKHQSPTYRFLQAREVEMIDEALSTLGEYGEVRLVIERGRLRFLITQRSYDTHKWRPGSLAPRK